MLAEEVVAQFVLLHRLNNQLGIILANAELLESKAPDDQHRARASQMIASTLDEMTTAKEIQQIVRKHQPGDSLKMTVERSGASDTVTLTIGDYPGSENQ